MKIALIARENLNIIKGGDTFVILKIKELLEKNGIHAELILNKNQFKENYDLYHLFNLGDLKTSTFYVKQILKSKKKFVLNPFWYKTDEIFYKIFLLWKDYSKYKKIFNFLEKLVGSNFLFNSLKILNRYRRDLKEEYTLKMASAIIIESPTIKNILVNYFLRLKKHIEEKIFILPLPIDDNFLSSSCREVSFNLNLTDYVLNVGRIGPLKNQIAIIKALVKNPEIPIILVGYKHNTSGNFKFYYQELDNLIKKRGNVVHINEVSTEELIYLYKNAKVYCHPSIFEPYGLSVLEAAYFDCNLVVTNNCGVKDYIEGEIFFIDPMDTEDLKEKLILALNKPKADKNLKINLDWQFYIKELIKIYYHILNA